MGMKMFRNVILILFICSTSLFSKTQNEEGVKSIAVFIPGVMAGSPIYEELDAGVREAAKNKNINIKTIEGGFNPGDWPGKVKEIAATGIYDLIVSSNPSMPEIFNEASKDFPNQKFICMDGKFEGNPNLYTAEYKQFDQAYLAGYMAGLVTLSNMEGANSDKKVGLIIAHHYPVLDDVLIPGFKKGLMDVDKGIQVDIRIVGNWWDATKAAELTNLMIAEGVDVFLSISGGATQGVITQCQDNGKYLVHFDSNGYSKAPGTVIGSTIIRQKELTKRIIEEFIQGKTQFGKAHTFSAKDGYVDFIQDDPLYQDNVPEDIKTRVAEAVRKIKQ